MAEGSPWQLQDRADPQRNHLIRDCNFQLMSGPLGRGEDLGVELITSGHDSVSYAYMGPPEKLLEDRPGEFSCWLVPRGLLRRVCRRSVSLLHSAPSASLSCGCS